ncbi:MAG TPA: cytochrome c oxidase subunit II [Trueperaceae bacterium]|nr:cytochrome c oxidase subunit II [Trueperaceae bacterium]
MPIRWMWRALPVTVIALLLSGCSLDGAQSTFSPAGPVAAEQLGLFMWTWYLSIPVMLLVGGVLVYVIVKYRRRGDDDTIPGQTHGNVLLEVMWTTIPVIIVILVAVPTVRSIFRLQSFVEAGGTDIAVNVVGHQWWWSFEYPQYGFTTANDLHVPVGAKIVLDLDTADVLHAFWAPRLGGKVDLIPNQDNQLWLQADEEGVFYGQCAELCLGAHAYMRFRIIVQPLEEFEAWVASFQAPAIQAVASDPLVSEGRQLIASKGCIGCHTIDNYAAGVNLGQAGFPNLTNFGLRSSVGAGVLDATLDNVTAWIADPQAIKPGNRMPTLWTHDDPNRDSEARAIAAYLLSLGAPDAVAGNGHVFADGAAGGN